MKTFLRFACLLALVLSPARAEAVDVVAQDTIDAYVISGSILLDSTSPEAVSAATCSNCQWRILRVCGNGTLEDRRGCLGSTCATAADFAEVWRADTATMPAVGDPAWTYRGMTCLAGPPLSVAEVKSLARQSALRSIPPLAPSSQPASNTLTGLATYFTSGQAGALNLAPADVMGVPVTVHAVPIWTWDFGHGAILTTTDPGGRWPTGRVRHKYPKRGIFRVRVSATWTATYDVRGLTQLPVDGVLTQSAWFDLRVREARRFLTPSKGA